ncbi:MFS transporter [Micromonospora sp. NBC_00617]|uniref:MFS transporter n=1 Tax=Micromonospora sp. NBC_00617 TaxID=2903587 RepID=UPI0038706625
MRGVSPLPPSGRLRTLSLATLANTVGSGLWLTGAAIYLTRDVGLSAAQVGVGLSVAGLVGLTASVPLGGLADRRDPRTLRAVLQVLQAVVAATYLLVGSFPVFLVVAVLDLLLASGNLAVRAALIAAVAGPQSRVHAFATLRAVANLGTGVGAGLAGFALAADTHLAYQILVAGNAATYLVSAALLLRLPACPPNHAALDRAALDRAALDHAGPNHAAPDHAGPNRADPDRAGPNRAALDRAGPNRAALDPAGPNRAAPDPAGPDHAGPDGRCPPWAAVA